MVSREQIIEARAKATRYFIVHRVAQLLKEHNMSQYRLKQVTGLSQIALQSFKPEGCMPALATLECLCRGLGITLGDFFNPISKDNTLLPKDENILKLCEELTPEQLEQVKKFAYALTNNEHFED